MYEEKPMKKKNLKKYFGLNEQDTKCFQKTDTDQMWWITFKLLQIPEGRQSQWLCDAG